jgi:hypothetical protein
MQERAEINFCQIAVCSMQCVATACEPLHPLSVALVGGKRVAAAVAAPSPAAAADTAAAVALADAAANKQARGLAARLHVCCCMVSAV